jgi:hypothetical protein
LRESLDDDDAEEPMLLSDAVKEFETDYEPFSTIRHQLKDYLVLFHKGAMTVDVYH